LQDDLAKFVSEPAPPPQLVEVLEEGKAKAKERREVGEVLRGFGIKPFVYQK
jgi:hypothetical protein